MIFESEKDKVVEISIKSSSAGAPCPIVLSDEHNLYVAYYLQDSPKEYQYQAIGLVKFRGLHAYQFGAPNDEAFQGHPLYEKGLKPYSSFEIKNSSWVAMFEKRNSVYPHHSKEMFSKLKHFVWSFHDTTLEVISGSYDFEMYDCLINNLVANIAKSLE